MDNCDSVLKAPFRRNQSSIASLSCSRGTFVPTSICPSARGNVSSNTLALVKLRMEKLSSHFSGQGRLFPLSSYTTRILRANIVIQILGAVCDSLVLTAPLYGDSLPRRRFRACCGRG